MIDDRGKALAEAHRLKYHRAVRIVEERLKALEIEPQTEINIQANYPTGWEAIVGAYDRLYIFTSVWGEITVTVEDDCGFYPNGIPRRTNYPPPYTLRNEELAHGVRFKVFPDRYAKVPVLQGEVQETHKARFGYISRRRT